MLRIAIVVPVLNQQEITQQFLNTIRASEGNSNLPLLIVDNGSTPPVRDWLIGLREGDLVIRNAENVGVLPALNQAYLLLKDAFDYIFYTHNDVRIFEKGWDEKLIRVLEEENANGRKVGVAGFYGAKGLGTGDIYHSPYIMQQMIRLENVSNCNRMDANHGYRNIRRAFGPVNGDRTPAMIRGEVENVAVMDGFSLIVSVDLLDETGGFDKTYPVHHNYDNDICLESLDRGYRNIVIAMDAQHLGGRTDVGEDWATPFGKTKQEIHTEAHPVMYEKWKPGKHHISMPIRIP